MTAPTIVAHAMSDEGHVVFLFSDGSLAVISGPSDSPTDLVVLDAAAHFLPGREPFYIRRSKTLQNVAYVHPMDSELMQR